MTTDLTLTHRLISRYLKTHHPKLHVEYCEPTCELVLHRAAIAPRMVIIAHDCKGWWSLDERGRWRCPPSHRLAFVPAWPSLSAVLRDAIRYVESAPMTTPAHLTSLLRDALPTYRLTHDDKSVVSIYGLADHGPPLIRAIILGDGRVEVQRRDALWGAATLCDDAGHAVRVITTALWGTT